MRVKYIKKKISTTIVKVCYVDNSGTEAVLSSSEITVPSKVSDDKTINRYINKYFKDMDDMIIYKTEIVGYQTSEYRMTLDAFLANAEKVAIAEAENE